MKIREGRLNWINNADSGLFLGNSFFYAIFYVSASIAPEKS